MTTTTFLAMLLVGAGLACIVVTVLGRVYRREEQLSEILDLPYGDRDVAVASAVDENSAIVENLSGFAGKVVESLDDKGALRARLERARIPMRPGEFVIVVGCTGAVAGAFLAAITDRWLLGAVALAVTPLVAKAVLDFRVVRRRKKFEAQFPDALTLIASSLSAGHTFLRSIQMMTEEAEAPLSEEFGRVVNETQLGDPLIDALERMASRLEIRDLDWVVQAIRIQQNVGGRLAELLHTLADFIRAREEIRREVQVLTAEGRISAWILGALPVFLFLFISVSDPEYVEPLYNGWGPVWLAGSAASVAGGILIIRRMVNLEV